jgi:hypothetical protein
MAHEAGLHRRARYHSVRGISIICFPINGFDKTVMNISERSPTPGPEALLDYGHGDFRVVRSGAFVRCAVTGAPIRLDDLRYWSVEFQEAYVSPEAVHLRLRRAGRA